ncbi:MAG: hypothetical protein IT318_26455 [Anaerolineales bacterium]|nr:hypothetical protein [Anaerolineales bacterium]
MCGVRIQPRHVILATVAVVIVTATFLCVRTSPYRPGLSPAPGYLMRNLTEPEGFVAGYVREVQAWWDITPCEYEVLGWADDGTLYYRANCSGDLQVWRAYPDEGARAAAVNTAPGGLTRDSVLKAVVLDHVRVLTARPVHVEPWVREVNLRSSGYPSPDGRWLAFVAERVYGPQDVLVLAEAP